MNTPYDLDRLLRDLEGADYYEYHAPDPKEPFYLSPWFIWTTRISCIPVSWILVIGIVMAGCSLWRHLG